MVKAAIIVQEQYPKDTRVRKYVSVLHEMDFEIEIIALREAGKPFREEQDGVTVFRTGFIKRRGGLLQYMLEYAAFYLMVCGILTLRSLQGVRYSFIHVNTLPDFLVFACALPKLLGSKLVLDFHEIAPEFYRVKFGVGERHLLVKLLLAVEKAAVLYSDRTITVNKRIREVFEQRTGVSNMAVVLNTPDMPETRERDIPDYSKRFNLIYSGSLTTLYNLELAIRAVQALRESLPQLTLQIYGEGQTRESLQRLIDELKLGERVILHGQVPQERLYREVLPECDAGILTLERNCFVDLSFSNKLAEYVAMRMPVVIPRIPAVADYFSEAALWYYDGSEEDLQRVITALATHPALAVQKASVAYAEYQPLAWSEQKRVYRELIAAVLEEQADERVFKTVGSYNE